MRLDAFLLADAVSAPPDGKLYLHGAGITKLTLPTIPFVVPQLGVIARFAVERDEEFARAYTFRVTITDPTGGLVLPPLELAGGSGERPDLAEGEEGYVVLGLHLGGLVIEHLGPHRVELALDDTVVREMSLAVVAA